MALIFADAYWQMPEGTFWGNPAVLPIGRLSNCAKAVADSEATPFFADDAPSCWYRFDVRS